MMDFDYKIFLLFRQFTYDMAHADNTVASVNLFQQNYPHQLMWKCHL